ncbi:hypothetical protein NE237_032453 [Protea cynaroides]|uniref:Uncharacterized protein n=1 Tax=Protea cynaroides TaxID=273540 RepID=A0A9Q0L418_9MAGN|nr:hypothetical protein NE237_032453 [Protea cynaroides]
MKTRCIDYHWFQSCKLPAPALSLGGFLLASFLLEFSQNLVLQVASETDRAVAIKASIISKQEIYTNSLAVRKLLLPSPSVSPRPGGGGNAVENRVGQTCSRNEIDIYQGATDPLPNGIPTYTAVITNVCSRGCSIANLHVSCEWFSSARHIDRKLFRRLAYNDCLVKNGESLAYGETLSFVYANSFLYPLAVSSLTCS